MSGYVGDQPKKIGYVIRGEGRGERAGWKKRARRLDAVSKIEVDPGRVPCKNGRHGVQAFQEKTCRDSSHTRPYPLHEWRRIVSYETFAYTILRDIWHQHPLRPNSVRPLCGCPQPVAPRKFRDGIFKHPLSVEHGESSC